MLKNKSLRLCGSFNCLLKAANMYGKNLTLTRSSNLSTNLWTRSVSKRPISAAHMANAGRKTFCATCATRSEESRNEACNKSVPWNMRRETYIQRVPFTISTRLNEQIFVRKHQTLSLTKTLLKFSYTTSTRLHCANYAFILFVVISEERWDARRHPPAPLPGPFKSSSPEPSRFFTLLNVILSLFVTFTPGLVTNYTDI